MYTDGLFITTFLSDVFEDPDYIDWRARVLDYANKFDFGSRNIQNVIEDIHCRVINDLEDLSFPLYVKDVQKLENIVGQLPLNEPTRVYERIHLLHYVIFEELSKNENS